MKKHLFASLAALSAAATLAAQERPNIVVFLVDDMGLMDTSVPFITDRILPSPSSPTATENPNASR